MQSFAEASDNSKTSEFKEKFWSPSLLFNDSGDVPAGTPPPGLFKSITLDYFAMK